MDIQNVVSIVESWRSNNGIPDNIDLTEAQMVQFATDLQNEVSKLSFESPKLGASVIAYKGE